MPLHRCRAVALLLEAVFGLGIFAAALVVSLGLILIVSASTDAAREYSLASQAGRCVLEDHMSRPFALLTNSGPTVFPVPVAKYHAGTFTHGSEAILNLTVSVTVAREAAVPPRYADITVAVSWDTGKPRQLFFEGCVGNY